MTVSQDFMLDLAAHLDGIAATIRRHYAPGDEPPETLTDDQVVPWGDADPVEVARSLHPLLGSHQELVIKKLAAAHPNGLTAAAINENRDTLPNTYITLDKLTELGLVRREDGRPRRYFLGFKMFKR